ncbi:MAG: hypothetical protein RQ922_05365, partial [Thermoproteota archaeon]|nr:hypothetical protein [Thermoproteota archaeon]
RRINTYRMTLKTMFFKKNLSINYVMDKCLKCGSRNIIFNSRFAEWICRDCLEIYYLEDIIELNPKTTNVVGRLKEKKKDKLK